MLHPTFPGQRVLGSTFLLLPDVEPQPREVIDPCQGRQQTRRGS
jgi:hypothetical protein